MTDTDTRAPRQQWRKLAGRIALIVAVPVLIGLSQHEDHGQAEPVAPSVSTGSHERGHIFEDDPRWDCRTMGNRVCGPGALVLGEPVAPGDYSRADAGGRPAPLPAVAPSE